MHYNSMCESINTSYAMACVQFSNKILNEIKEKTDLKRWNLLKVRRGSIHCMDDGQAYKVVS